MTFRGEETVVDGEDGDALAPEGALDPGADAGVPELQAQAEAWPPSHKTCVVSQD